MAAKVKVANFDEAVQEIRRRVTASKNFDARVRFTFDDGKTYLVDGHTTPPSFDEGGTNNEDVTLTMGSDIFIKITNGELIAPVAMATGKVKAKGNLMKAMSLSKVLD
ncbi:SCP2 sterol-binding domain-containing protein [Rhizobium sp. FKY42]|uniref:SCP2 sterol-binding domain-containing protein n=1 Tax=Rhizobium sp. FKY42 TaxID=2562310 RepID=UPI0010BF8C47|nr:SCP2 sterol-binding domain-containing protein [Rhizobium sp. FKY42]